MENETAFSVVLMKLYYPCNFDDFKPHKMGVFQPLNDYLYMPLNKGKEKRTNITQL